MNMAPKKKKFCEKCCSWFDNKSNLNAHIKARHNSAETVEGFSCPRCEKVYRQRRNVKTHFFKKHSNSEEEWESATKMIKPTPTPNKSNDENVTAGYMYLIYA